MQKSPSAVIIASRAQASRRCETQASLSGKAAKLWLAFRSLDLFRALREPDRRRRDEKRPCRSEQKTATNQNDYLTGKAPYKSCKPAVPQRLLASPTNRSRALLTVPPLPPPGRKRLFPESLAKRVRLGCRINEDVGRTLGTADIAGWTPESTEIKIWGERNGGHRYLTSL